MGLDKFKYKGVIITYAGFKMDNQYCFYGYYKDNILYLSETQFKKLERVEKTQEEINEDIEIENYFRNGLKKPLKSLVD